MALSQQMASTKHEFLNELIQKNNQICALNERLGKNEKYLEQIFSSGILALMEQQSKQKTE
jgi:hypothetical protein